MKEGSPEEEAVRRYVQGGVWSQIPRVLKLLELILRPYGKPGVRRPTKIEPADIFTPVRASGPQRFTLITEKASERLYITPEYFASEVEIRAEFLIQSNPIDPRVEPLGIVEKLVEAGHLSWFDRLVLNVCEGHGAESRSPDCGIREWRPHDADFGVELFPVQVEYAALIKIRACSERPNHIFRIMKLRVGIHVAAFCIRFQFGNLLEKVYSFRTVKTGIPGPGDQVEILRSIKMLHLTAIPDLGVPLVVKRRD